MPEDPYTPEQKDARGRVHRAIQATNEANPELEGSVLVGWVLVAEWSDEEGERWLSRLSGSGGGDHSPPRWQVEGYMNHALRDWAE